MKVEVKLREDKKSKKKKVKKSKKKKDKKSKKQDKKKKGKLLGTPSKRGSHRGSSRRTRGSARGHSRGGSRRSGVVKKKKLKGSVNALGNASGRTDLPDGATARRGNGKQRASSSAARPGSARN